MIPSAANVRRHFLPWDRPLLPQAVAFLADGWSGDGPLDLARLMVVVPTRQSGRRLREALAEHAAARGQAVFPPRVLTPEDLLAQDLAADVASSIISLLAWAEVFGALELDAFREVFPVDPPARDFAWALRLARQFARLQKQLTEGGLRLADVVEKAGGDFPEAARWQQLGELERLHAGKLSTFGLRDAQAAKISAAQNPPPIDAEKIILLATPDPLPLALTALSAHARMRPVEIVVYAPFAEAAAFDEWGRPLAPAWTQRVLALPEFERHVHLCADPTAQAERIAVAARGYKNPEGLLGVGAADAEVLPSLENALRRAGVAAFNPEGQLRRHDRLYALLAALAEFAAEPRFDALAALLRCPDVLDWLRARQGKIFSPATLLGQLDELRAKHLPPTLAAARMHTEKFPAIAPALTALDGLREMLDKNGFVTGATGVLALIFADRPLDLARPSDAQFEDSAIAWMEVLRECAAASVHFPGLARAEWWSLALQRFGEVQRTEDKPAGALELQGWLELPFEDAPHLVVAGLNDGRVPEAVVGDPFLPESLRERLGLKTNAARFARDAFLLQALAASRAAGGRLDLLFGKTSTVGDPLRPSRLLLSCADLELPRRIEFLFRPAELADSNLAWTRAWPLAPRRISAPGRVSVTALRDWLQCPFRFYLRHILGMAAVDPVKNELDALDFGTLCHVALEAMGRESSLRDCTDAALLRDFLLAKLEHHVRARYGEDLALPLVIQVESARQRLAKAAEIQATERAAGWVIECVEKKFTVDMGGLTVSGKIDRIDRHADGRVRILDYKTSDKPAAPRDRHFRSPRADEASPEWSRCEIDGKSWIWSDLQLPLYRRALAAEIPGAMACGYFNLPKAVVGTGLWLWEDYTPELQAAAQRCVEGVCAAIHAEMFWPPNEHVDPQRDDFAGLFHHGAAASIAWQEAAR